MIKGLHDNMKIEVIPDLLRVINEELEKRKKEALVMQKEQKANLLMAVQEEGRFTREIDKNRKIAEKMQKEYLDLEGKIEIMKRQRIKENSITEEAVKIGRASFKEFVQKGKRESEILKMATEETVRELSKGLEAIRSKNLEIIKLEESLYECRLKIQFLLVEPAKIFLKSLGRLKEFTEGQLSAFLESINSSRVALNAKKEEITLIEKGVKLGPGHCWNQITIEAAHKIMFSPILHKEAIPRLKAELKKYEGTDQLLNVTYYWKSKEIGINLIQKKKEIE